MTAESGELRSWLASGAKAVRRARSTLDRINVFPIADADTGTNMYLTLQEGNRAVAKLPNNASHREVAAAFARGALLGARGNSGVIVSQYLGAFLNSVDHAGGLSKVNAKGIAAALDAASTAAYSAVGAPVEGTILTVAAAAARGAVQAVGSQSAASRHSREKTIVAAVVAAREALVRTTEQLPVAKAAGVVDAGAAGLVLQLEMLAETLAGTDALAGLDEPEWEITSTGRDVIAVPVVHHDHDGKGGVYEVMFVARDADADAAAPDSPRGTEERRRVLSTGLAELGDSVAVTGARGVWQAHVHTNDAGAAVAFGVTHRARQIVVRNILMSRVGDRAATGVVALTSCPGLANPLADAGAVVLVVPDPSKLKRRELRRAVRDASGSEAVVVAGNPVLRASAVELAERKRGPRTRVLDSVHEAQVVAAVAASAMVTPGEDLAARMAAAVGACAVASSSVDALDDDVDRLLTPDVEVITLILGRGVPAGVADRVRLSAAAVCPAADVAVYHGEHGLPGVLIGVERAT